MRVKPERVVGYVSGLGYLYCDWCAGERDIRHRCEPVYEGSQPHADDFCDVCAKHLLGGGQA